jgi:hypothetical protein
MKNRILEIARIVVVSAIIFSMVTSVSAKEKEKRDGIYQTGFIRWRAAENGFAGWTLSGVRLNAGALEFDSSTAVEERDPYPAGQYNGGNYYNGNSFIVGEATSQEFSTAFNYTEAIASWNASTPAGSWVEVQFRAKYGTRWTDKWYVLGIWASDDSTIRRHSVQSQGNADGFIAVDTFVSSNKKESPNAFQLKLRLFSTNGAIPSVRNASVAYSTSAPKTAVASPNTSTHVLLNVPECSQMVYPDGGEVWCSPTSTSMVLGFWNAEPGTDCAAREITTVEGVYDWIYNGHGNWPFNTAYAATKQVGTQKLEGYVARFSSLRQAEEFVTAGVPVIMSIAWGKGDLTNSDIDSTNGHLLVLVGFDGEGNPIVNDPASPANETVQRTYLRSEFEPLWLEASGGTVYLIYPEGTAVPAIQ